VPIDPAPVHAPTPVGSQAPSKPVDDLPGSKHRPESRRETIAKAFSRARGEEPSAKPGMGHNNPPEPMEREFNLRKPPPKPRERGEGGRFAASKPQEGREPPAAAPGVKPQMQSSAVNRGQQQPGRPPQPGQAQAAHSQVSPLPENAPFRQPPPRMHPRAQAEWAAAPESVRGEVHRMQAEFGRAYQQYRGDHEAMNSIRSYHDLARSHGTTLERALNNYVSMENKLRSDPIGGLDVIVNNLNLRTPEGQRITLRDIAWHVLNQTPDQHRVLQTQNTQSAQSQQIGQLHQIVNSLAQNQQRMQYTQAFAHTRRQVDRYAETHPRLDELGDLIERELRLGFDLDTAYKRANLLRPPHAAQTRTQTAQTRPTDRSISGAPDGGAGNGASRRSGNRRLGDRRETIARAIKQVNGSL
jgi:hypothetical protein